MEMYRIGYGYLWYHWMERYIEKPELRYNNEH